MMEEEGNKKMASSSKCFPRPGTDPVRKQDFLDLPRWKWTGSTQPRQCPREMGQDNVGQFAGLHSVQGAAINTFPSHGPLWFPEGSGPLWLPFQVWTDPETTSPVPLPTVCCLPFALLWSQVSFIVNLPGNPGEEMQVDKGQCARQSHALKETPSPKCTVYAVRIPHTPAFATR